MAPFSEHIVEASTAVEEVLALAAPFFQADAGIVSVPGPESSLVTVASWGLTPAEVEAVNPALKDAIMRDEGWIGPAQTGQLLPIHEPEGLRGRQMLLLPIADVAGIDAIICILRRFEHGRFQEADAKLLFAFSLAVKRVLARARPRPSAGSDQARLQDLQNTFVSIVSHELQTPVAIIKGYAGTLRRPDASWSPAIVQRVAATIEAECDRLTRLITDLLDLARIQAGRVAMTFGPVDLPELLTEVVDLARARAPSREIALQDVTSLPVIRGDHDKLRMALSNLLDNATKYSPAGGLIAVGGAVRDGRVLLWVRDQGIGIAAEEQERVFERFHRVDSSLTRETPGAGMGLYICKVIVEAHNGRVWAESEGLGRGSTFFISLPDTAP